MLKFYFFSLVLFLCTALPAKPLKQFETISVHLELTGDVRGSYDLKGPLGQKLKAESSLPDSKCLLEGLFRRVLENSKPKLEFWMELICMFEGQQNTYKVHRLLLSPADSDRKIQLSSLGKNIENLQIHVQNLSLKKRK